MCTSESLGNKYQYDYHHPGVTVYSCGVVYYLGGICERVYVKYQLSLSLYNSPVGD